MFVINKSRFRTALKENGYGSVGELAEHLGVHRNTIQYFLAGRRVLPESLEKAFHALHLDVQDVIQETQERKPLLDERVAALVDDLSHAFPDMTFVLFGSRGEGRAHKYSDWDIGVFREVGLSHDDYMKVVRIVSDAAENFPYFVQITNLNIADRPFLKRIARGWHLLAGSQKDWLTLQRMAS